MPDLPEVDQINFVTRVTTPVLMLNGRYDFVEPVETSQQPMFDLLATPAADKRHVIFETGHAVVTLQADDQGSARLAGQIPRAGADARAVTSGRQCAEILPVAAR